MFSLSTSWAVVLRLCRAWARDFNLFLMTSYWPLLDILIWGFLGTWITQFQVTNFKNYETVALLGILLWQVIGRGANIIAFSFLEELWAYNVVNLFSLPIRIGEWMLGIILFDVIIMAFTSLFCILVILLLYDVSLSHLLSTFALFLPPLFFSSIWIGFTCLQMLIIFGKRGIEVGFVIAWSLMPFSGAFYPLEVLPDWAQKFSALFPMGYVFTGMRNYLMHQEDPTPFLIKGYVLSIAYAIFALLLFVYCFNRSKEKGLARLTD